MPQAFFKYSMFLCRNKSCPDIHLHKGCACFCYYKSFMSSQTAAYQIKIIFGVPKDLTSPYQIKSHMHL